MTTHGVFIVAEDADEAIALARYLAGRGPGKDKRVALAWIAIARHWQEMALIDTREHDEWMSKLNPWMD